MSQSVWDSDFGAVFKQRYDILKGIDIKKGVMGAVGGAVGHMVDPTGVVGPAIGGGLGAELDKSEKMEKEKIDKTGYMDNEYNRLNPIGGDKPTATGYEHGDSLPPNRPQPYNSPRRKQDVNDEDLGDLRVENMNKSLYKAIRSVDRVLKELRVVDTGLKGERVGEIRHDSNPKGSSGGGTTAPRPKERKLPIKKEEEFAMSMNKSLNKSIKSVTKMLHKLDSCGGSTAGLNIKNVKAKKDGGGVYPSKTPPKPKTRKA